VFGVDRARTTATQIVRVGVEKGNIIQPVAFGAASDGSFVVADAPFGRERVQLFAVDGTRLRGFALPGRVEPRVQLGGMVLNGVGSLQYDGESIYVNEPDRGALITEYSLEGRAVRTIGRLRATGYESDRTCTPPSIPACRSCTPTAASTSCSRRASRGSAGTTPRARCCTSG
jgi:hypothetical protein